MRLHMVINIEKLNSNSFNCMSSSTHCTGCNDGVTHRSLIGDSCICPADKIDIFG